MSKWLPVKQVFGEVPGEKAGGKKRRRRTLGSRAARGFGIKELEEIAARALRLADMTTKRQKKGPVDVPRLEALTALGHAAMKLVAILERIKAQARERERKEDADREVARG